MKRYLFIILTLFSTACFAKPLLFAYNGLKFDFPNNPIAIGSNSGTNNSLLVVYARGEGKGSIMATTDISIETGQCDLQVFFTAVIQGKTDYPCGELEHKSFRKVFMDNAEVGIWQGHNAPIFYFLAEEMGHVFILDGEQRVGLSSSFLTKEQWIKLLVRQIKD